MRMAYLCADPGVPVYGKKGSSVHVQEVIRALLREGATVEIFATAIGGEPPAELENVRTHQLPAAPKGDQAQRELALLAANEQTLAALHSAGSFDAVYERYSLWSNAGAQYAAARGAPLLLEVNSPLIEEQAAHRGLVHEDLALGVAQQVFNTAATLLAVSDEVAGYLRRFPVAGSRIEVLANGVDPGRFPADLRPTMPTAAGSFVVGFVGTLKPWHGLPVLVEAFSLLHRQVPEARLLIVGDGPERERLAEDLHNRDLAGAAHLAGAVEPLAVPGLLALMDVAVAPYPSLENFYFSPLKVYEYMAAGLPVVASRIGQLEKLIGHGVDGLLCRPGSSADLAAALQVLACDPPLRARLGRAGRAKVLRDHTWQAVAARILSLATATAPAWANRGR